MVWKRGGKQAFPYELVGPTVPILSHGAIGVPEVASGRLVPIVLLDLAERPDFRAFIETHNNFPPGDVTSAWGRERKLASDPNELLLILQFLRPLAFEASIRFDMRTDGAIADLAMRSRGLWVQFGAVGERVRDTFDTRPKVILEIAGEFPRKKWLKRWRNALVRRFQAEGYSPNQVKDLVNAYISRNDSLPQGGTNRVNIETRG